jgi:hypothetical protein
MEPSRHPDEHGSTGYREERAAARRAMIEPDIQDGSHALGQRGRRRHCERTALGNTGRYERAGNVEQLLGVVDRTGPERHHAIVAGLLLFQPRAMRGAPREGVGPVERAGELDEQVPRVVATPDVRQFVPEHDPPPFRVPAAGGRGQQHHRPAESPGHRHGELAADRDSYRLPDTEVRRHLAQEVGQGPASDRRGPAGHLADPAHVPRETAEHQERAREP